MNTSRIYHVPTLLLSLALLLTTAWEARAIVTNWTNAAGGNWGEASNWDNGVPGPADTAMVWISGDFTVIILPSDSFSVTRVMILYATLRIEGDLTLTSGIYNPLAVFSDASVDVVGGTLTVIAGAEPVTEVGGSGQIQVLGNGTVALENASIGHLIYLSLSSAGALRLEDGATIACDSSTYCYVNIQNNAQLIWDGGTSAGSATISPNVHIVNSTSSMELHQGMLHTGDIVCYGTLKLLAGSQLAVSGFDFGQISIQPGGQLLMEPPSNIIGQVDSNGYSSSIVSVDGLFRMDSLTSAFSSSASCSLRAYYWQFPGTNRQTEILRGHMVMSVDTAASGGNHSFSDTVYICPTCSLSISSASYFYSSSLISGLGYLGFFADANASITGGFSFNGTLNLRDSAVVNLVQSYPDTVTLSTLFLYDDSWLYIANFKLLMVDAVYHFGGGLYGRVQAGTSYGWSGGTLAGPAAESGLVPVGSMLTAFSGKAKNLDSLTLTIEGSATLQDSGKLSTHAGIFEVAPGGTLDVLPAFHMDGTGLLYNAGHSTFDPQLDSIVINVPVINSTIARTPGTIDILSAPIVFGASGRNGGAINVLPNGDLILAGGFRNSTGTVTVVNGGTLNVVDSLINESAGQLLFDGGSSVEGSGTIYNGGQMNSQGSALLSVTNVPVSPVLVNLYDSGFVNVLQDTLTLLNGGVNKGMITIQTGAVLKIYGTFLNDTTGFIGGGGVLDVSMASFTNNGTINPGSSPGTLAINGSPMLGPLSHLFLELNGPSAAQYDRLQVSGSLALGGTLDLVRGNGYVPATTDSLLLLTYTGRSGSFADITGLSLGEGSYLNVEFGTTGASSYRCGGASEIAVSSTLIQDSIYAESLAVCVFSIAVCDTGYCPLNYTAAIVAPSPVFPAWVSIVSGTGADVLISDLCGNVQVRVDGSVLPAGSAQATLRLSSNAEAHPVVDIPIQITIVRSPEQWDLGGGTNGFPTFTAAASYLNSTTIALPQVFHVYPGVYTETLILNSIAGASAINTISFVQADAFSPAPLLTSSLPAVVQLIGADHVIFDGINVALAEGIAGAVVLDSAGADSNVFRNFSITGGDSAAVNSVGVSIPAAAGSVTNDGNLIENVSIRRTYTAISLGSGLSTFNSAVGNEVRDCALQGVVRGIDIRYQHMAWIHDNDIAPASGLAGSTVYGIRLLPSGTLDLVHVRGNHIIGATTPGAAIGIDCGASGIARIYNNFLSLWEGVHGSSTGMQISGGSSIGVYDNSILMSENTDPAAVSIKAIALIGAAANVTLKNNVLACESTLDSSWSIWSMFPLAGGFVCDYNCFWGTGIRYSVGRTNTGNRAVLPSWQAATGRDLHSIQDFPGFASSTDLHIDGYYTTCDSRGTLVSEVPVDIDGQARNGTTPDIGADEFIGISNHIDSLVIRKQPASLDIRLEWESVAGAQSYKIFAGDSLDFVVTAETQVGTSPTNSFIHTGAVGQSNPKHYYRVRPSTLQ